jgi:hypothetical protein
MINDMIFSRLVINKGYLTSILIDAIILIDPYACESFCPSQYATAFPFHYSQNYFACWRSFYLTLYYPRKMPDSGFFYWAREY